MQNNRRNYYRILHVQPDAPVEIIRTSYRTLMQKLRCHPDLGGDDWNAALLNEALVVLTDAGKRAAYDAACGLGGDSRRREKNSAGSEQACAETVRENDARSTAYQYGTGRSHAYQTDSLTSCLFCGIRSSGAVFCVRCESPLQPPPTIDRNPSDQRAFERLAIEANVLVFVHWPQNPGYPAIIRNLTPGGMQITLHDVLAPNQIVKISSERIGSISRVASCNIDTQGRGFNIGLQFLSLYFHNPRGGFVSEKA